MKKYGNVVLFVSNGVERAALVAQSAAQPDGEHLTVVSLDPSFESPIIGGSTLAQAIKTDFVTPLKEGGLNGWKDGEFLTETQILTIQENAQDDINKNELEWEKRVQVLEAANDAAVAELKKVQATNVALDAELYALKNQKPEPAPNSLTDDEVYDEVKANLLNNGQVVVPDGAHLDQVVAAVNRFLKEQAAQPEQK